MLTLVRDYASGKAQTARSCRPEALGEAASLKELLMTTGWEMGKAVLLTAQKEPEGQTWGEPG